MRTLPYQRKFSSWTRIASSRETLAEPTQVLRAALNKMPSVRVRSFEGLKLSFIIVLMIHVVRIRSCDFLVLIFRKCGGSCTTRVLSLDALV